MRALLSLLVATSPVAIACVQSGAPPSPPPPPYAYAAPPQYGYAPAPNVARPVEACAEGGYGCSADRRALTVCRGGRLAIASTCRGPRGCSVGNAVDCDHAIAALGDACETPKEIACSLDGKQLLRCFNGVYQTGEACPNACLSTSGRVLCQ